MKAILLMLGALSAAIIFVGCGTAVGRATGVDTEESYDLMEQEYEEKKKEYAFTYSYEILNECTSIEAQHNLDLVSPELGLVSEFGYWVKDAIIEWENELLAKTYTCMNDKGAYGTIEYDGKPSETWVGAAINGEHSINFRFVPSEDDILKTMESPQFLAKYENNIQTLTIAFNGQIAALEEKRLEEERVARQIQEAIEQAEEERREQERREEAERIAEALETERRETARICEEAWAENDMERVKEFNCGKPQFATPIPTPIPTLTREEILERCRNSTPVIMGVPSYIRARELGQPVYARCLREHGIEEELQWPGWPGMEILIIEECRIGIPTPMMRAPREGETEEQIREGFFNYMQDMFTECLRENGIEEDIEYEESLNIERQREQDQDVAPLAEQAEELAEEEAPVDGTAEERIAALEERVAELTELIRELTEALQPN